MIEDEHIRYLTLILLTIVVVMISSFILRRILSYFIRKSSGQILANPTGFIYIKNSISFILFIAGTIFIILNVPYFKNVGTALFAGAGIVAAIIGFASQKAFSNIIGGLFILIFKPFKVGDVIEMEHSAKGVVEEITLRHTIIRDYENRRMVVPNTHISEETIINSSITEEKICKHIDFGIAYSANIDQAIDLARHIIENHPLCIDNRREEEIETTEKVVIKVVELGDFSVNLRAFVWTKNNPDAFELKCDFLKEVKETFDREGIEIPFPYRNVIIKSESLNPMD